MDTIASGRYRYVINGRVVPIREAFTIERWDDGSYVVAADVDARAHEPFRTRQLTRLRLDAELRPMAMEIEYEHPAVSARARYLFAPAMARVECRAGDGGAVTEDVPMTPGYSVFCHPAAADGFHFVTAALGLALRHTGYWVDSLPEGGRTPSLRGHERRFERELLGREVVALPGGACEATHGVLRWRDRSHTFEQHFWFDKRFVCLRIASGTAEAGSLVELAEFRLHQ